MKIYVTKYTMTDGVIREMEAEEPPAFAPGMAPVGAHGCFHGKERHRTRKAALAHAEAMRTRKLAALDKQRKKIEAMAFG